MSQRKISVLPDGLPPLRAARAMSGGDLAEVWDHAAVAARLGA